jgi:hypothetical protein
MPTMPMLPPMAAWTRPSARRYSMSWDCTLLDAGGLAPAARKPPGDSFTGDEKLQAEGKMDKAKGAAHEAAGDVKDKARDMTR